MKNRTWKELNDEFLTEAYSGFPVPMSGLDLSLAKGYVYREGYRRYGLAELDNDELDERLNRSPKKYKLRDLLRKFNEWKLVNRWYSKRLGNEVIIMRSRITGKTAFKIRDRTGDGLQFLLSTYAAAGAWNLETETVAQAKLKTLVNEQTFQRYMLIGQIWEKSRRSGVEYLFRRSRPTLACRVAKDKSVKVLAALCLHPIGYYQSTWAGVMVPTDEIIAHLLLMRGDEHRLWKKAFHHVLDDPATGV